MTFYIPYLNPIRFTGGAGDKFDRLLMVDLINKFQEHRCYFQKWNVGDSTKMQILSDWEFTFKIYELENNVQVADITPTVFANSIEGQTFTVYEVDIPFPEPGEFYAVIEYEGNTLISEPFEVGDFSDCTLFFKYRNSENNFSVVFDNGFEFRFRVEGVVADFEPKSEDVIYNDQQKNSRILNAVPWRSFTMYVGNELGIPDWVADKANRLMACDVVHVDSKTFDGYISKVEGAEWEVTRSAEQPFLGVKVEIMPVENSLLERLKRADGDGSANFTIVQKVNNYFNVGPDLVIPGTFGKYRLLEKICIEKTIGDPSFFLKVGTTSGGQEIGIFEIVEPDTTILINKLFLADQTLYLSGIANPVPFLSVIWKNLIENPVGPGTPPASTIPLGGIMIYSPMPGRVMSDDFNLITGLGIEGTGWFGWAVCNGLNDTPNLGDSFVLGFKNGVNTDNQTGGEAQVTLNLTQIPSHSHKYRNAVGTAYQRGNTGSGMFDNGNPPAPEKDTSSVGGGLPHNNMPPFVVKAYVQKIF